MVTLMKWLTLLHSAHVCSILDVNSLLQAEQDRLGLKKKEQEIAEIIAKERSETERKK